MSNNIQYRTLLLFVCNLIYLFIRNGLIFYSTAKVINPENVILDDCSIISDFCFILASNHIRIGKYKKTSPYCSITGGGELYIKYFADIQYGVRVLTGSDNVYNAYLSHPNVVDNYRKKVLSRVEIGSYTFIGVDSIVFPGAKIGEGTIVNPGTIVKGNLKPWSIYNGKDCKFDGLLKNKEEILERAKICLNSKA